MKGEDKEKMVEESQPVDKEPMIESGGTRGEGRGTGRAYEG